MSDLTTKTMYEESSQLDYSDATMDSLEPRACVPDRVMDAIENDTGNLPDEEVKSEIESVDDKLIDLPRVLTYLYLFVIMHAFCRLFRRRHYVEVQEMR